jgi:hypothetical protein
MNDTSVADALDELTPRYDDRPGDWERIAAAARRARRTRRSRAALPAAVALVAAALLLAWPFHARHGSVLDRALAAVGDGPLLHVVLRGDWGGTLVSLSTGERTPIYGEDEYWWNTDHPRVHLIERLGNAVQHDELYVPREPPRELAALGRDYRRALEDKTASVDGEGNVDGEPVAWVTIHRELRPDVADGKNHEWAQQVAVSRGTFEPVALRETRDGEPAPMTRQRVLGLQFLPKGTGNFSRPEQPSLEGRGFSRGRRSIRLEDARVVLGREAVWLGREYRGLPLAEVDRETLWSGRRPEVRITGAKATAAIRCSKLRAQARGCFRSLALGSISIRPDGVFTSGRFRWDDKENSVVLFYGSLGDDPSAFRKDSVPLYDRPHVTVTETTRASRFRPFVGSYIPPAGSIFIAANRQTGVLYRDGLHVTIEAADEQAILAAAHALELLPA